MQKLSSDLLEKPVVGVQNAEILGTITGFIVRPDDFKIAVCIVTPLVSKSKLYLLPSDIRLVNNNKIIIDSHQKLSEFEDLVRYQHDITNNYSVIGNKVETTTGKKLGRVKDFIFDPAHFYISKLYVRPRIFKTFLVTNLLIDRADVIDVKKNTIIVKDNFAKIKKASPSVLPQSS
ncbi:MAG: PRC-barrel protein [Patescibacteria group bacterium]|jgi:uncharacterized protein YrrD|nr:PRC-barrel protein [Patescibacteria group bacterium]